MKSIPNHNYICFLKHKFSCSCKNTRHPRVLQGINPPCHRHVSYLQWGQQISMAPNAVFEEAGQKVRINKRPHHKFLLELPLSKIPSCENRTQIRSCPESFARLSTRCKTQNRSSVQKTVREIMHKEDN